MASGDTLLLLFPQDNSPPATVYATFDIMVGTSTPAEAIPVLDFDDTTVEYADFYCVMPANYAGGRHSRTRTNRKGAARSGGQQRASVCRQRPAKGTTGRRTATGAQRVHRHAAFVSRGACLG